MARRKILHGLTGWSLSSAVIVLVALAAIQIQFGGSLASYSAIGLSLGIQSYLITSLVILALYWMCSVIFGRDNILSIFSANILLVIALVMFCVVILNYVFQWLPVQMIKCIDLPTDIAVSHKRCDVSNFWFQVFDYGSLIVIFASLAVRIIQSRKLAELET